MEKRSAQNQKKSEYFLDLAGVSQDFHPLITGDACRCSNPVSIVASKINNRRGYHVQ